MTLKTPKSKKDGNISEVVDGCLGAAKIMIGVFDARINERKGFLDQYSIAEISTRYYPHREHSIYLGFL